MQNQFILTPYFLDQASPDMETLAKPDWVLNQPKLTEGNTMQRISALHRSLASAVEGSIGRGLRPVSLVGDCCAAIPMIYGLQRSGISPLLIWFDAHGDFNTWETTPSGFLGGMPLAMLVGRGEQTFLEALSMRPFPEAQVILSDGRDLDPGERLALQTSSVRHLPDVSALLNEPLTDQSIYIHFDVDVINPLDAPAMSYATPGGPRASELARVFRYLAQTGNIVAVSLSAWNPELDQSGQTRDVCIELLDLLVSA